MSVILRTEYYGHEKQKSLEVYIKWLIEVCMYTHQGINCQIYYINITKNKKKE